MPPVPPQKRMKLDQLDPRFDFDEIIKDWRTTVAGQPIWSSEIQLLEAINSSDESKVTFEMPSSGTLLPGNSTRFYIEGIFEMKKAGEETWTAVPNTEADKVMVCPNWFEKLVNVHIFTGTQPLNLNDEPAFLTPYLNEMLYAHMHPALKKYLCIEDSHPGHAAVIDRSDWDFEGKTWKEYSPKIFKGGKFNFSWIPTNAFPFFQNGAFVLDTQHPPRAIPLSLFDRNNKVVLEWKTNNLKLIFKKKADNTSEYRVKFSKPKLAIEVGMENPKQPPFSKGNELLYVGPTRKSISEDIVSDSMLHTRMTGMILPPSILVFVMPAKFAGDLVTAESIGFLKHQIKSITVKFNQQVVYNSETYQKNEEIGIDKPQNWVNHHQYPIASIPVDKNTMTFDMLNDDGTSYAFPHLYIRLSPGYLERNVPFNVDFKSFTQPGNLDIEVKFVDGKPPVAKSMLICYALYNDVNAVVNLKTKQFLNRYNNMLL